jgi:hypothetical protein
MAKPEPQDSRIEQPGYVKQIYPISFDDVEGLGHVTRKVCICERRDACFPQSNDLCSGEKPLVARTMEAVWSIVGRNYPPEFVQMPLQDGIW